MKKIFILAVAAMAMTSCSTVLNTASVNDVDNKILAGAVADLEVSPPARNLHLQDKGICTQRRYKELCENSYPRGS